MPANCAFRRLLVKCVASTLCRSAAAANLRAPPPPQLNSTADLQQLCTEQLGLCVVGALNPGVAVHSRHLDNLGAIAMKEAGKVGFLHRVSCCSGLWLDVTHKRSSTLQNNDCARICKRLLTREESGGGSAMVVLKKTNACGPPCRAATALLVGGRNTAATVPGGIWPDAGRRPDCSRRVP